MFVYIQNEMNDVLIGVVIDWSGDIFINQILFRSKIERMNYNYCTK